MQEQAFLGDQQGCRYSSGSAGMKSAALPVLLSTALLRAALTPLAHAFWRPVMSSRRRAAGQQSPRPHAALHNMMRVAASFGKPWYAAYHGRWEQKRNALRPG
jgi:hypothetical protein